MFRLKDSELDLDALTKELSNMHASRAVRALNTKKMLASSQVTLLDVQIQEIGFRSRAVAIKMAVLGEMLTRDEIVSKVRKYILTTYAEDLKESFKTLTAQKSYIEVLLEPYTKLSTHMSHVLKLADLVIEDLDQASWGLKNIKETLELGNKERYQ